MIKQTQTKMFDFSDADLDFCAGSKNKFPSVFKKMLAQGYNSKVVSSVTIAGDQVTLDYGVSHGYVADRVLAINTPGLVGEFYIDSVTSNTITMTVANATTSIAGGFTTKVAPLGWELVYENAHIHIYKFKHIDDTDMYARFCFQNTTTTARNCVAVGLGRTVNLATGVITDQNCPDDLRACATVADATSNVRWDFSSGTARTYDSYTYSQGLAVFGKGLIVGSPYHLVLFYSIGSSGNMTSCAGIFPFESDYQNLNYPVLLAQNNNASTASISSAQQTMLRLYCGKIRCSSTNQTGAFSVSFAASSFLPTEIDEFNTTTCFPISIFTTAEYQYLGYLRGGIYIAAYASTNIPAAGPSLSPSLTTDIDYTNICPLHGLYSGSGYTWLTAPVEMIKHA
jgi:hypothetical protein